MTPERFEAYRKAVSRGPLVRVSDLDAGDHTLTTGYEVERDDIHVYVMDGTIHVVTYQGTRLIEHEWHQESAPAHLLRPSKRAYPHTTNEKFAYLMRNADSELTFLGYFNWDTDEVRAEMAMEPFKAPTHLDF